MKQQSIYTVIDKFLNIRGTCLPQNYRPNFELGTCTRADNRYIIQKSDCDVSLII